MLDNMQAPATGADKTPSIKTALELTHDKELVAPISDLTYSALLKDADLYPPVKNANGATSYSVIQVGITDRSTEIGAKYYSRKVDVTVPNGATRLDDFQFNFNSRDFISEDSYKQLLKKDIADGKEMAIYTHGVNCPENKSDKQAIMLELTNGCPTVNIDWTANPPKHKTPINELIQYEKDTAEAQRANNDKDFVSAIDNTVQQIGAQRTAMIGFSHGGMFDTRYLEHRIQSHLPPLNTVILAHPDIPVGAPELCKDDNPFLFREASEHSFVIGSQNDLALKIGATMGNIPGSTTFEHGQSEERLGDDSTTSRLLIAKEGAAAIKERDQDKISSHHFLNYAGVNQLLQAGDKPINQIQTDYNAATDLARQNPQTSTQIVQDNISDTPSPPLPKENLDSYGSSNIRGSGEPYPYPNQTGWDSPQGSGDYNPYKYQDGNIYH